MNLDFFPQRLFWGLDFLGKPSEKASRLPAELRLPAEQTQLYKTSWPAPTHAEPCSLNSSPSSRQLLSLPEGLTCSPANSNSPPKIQFTGHRLCKTSLHHLLSPRRRPPSSVSQLLSHLSLSHHTLQVSPRSPGPIISSGPKQYPIPVVGTRISS